MKFLELFLFLSLSVLLLEFEIVFESHFNLLSFSTFSTKCLPEVLATNIIKQASVVIMVRSYIMRPLLHIYP